MRFVLVNLCKNCQKTFLQTANNSCRRNIRTTFPDPLPDFSEKWPTFKSQEAAKLWGVYQGAKTAAQHIPLSNCVKPNAVFANNELDLSRIHAWGFDYDFTLAVYTKELNTLIFEMALKRLIEKRKYPKALLDMAYDPQFVIRGLHYDVYRGVLLKLDAFLQIQYGTVYRGKTPLSVSEVDELYHGDSIPKSYMEPDQTGMRPMQHLTDLFSLPEAGLLVTIVDYFETISASYNPLSLYKDVHGAVRDVHLSGHLYAAVIKDMRKYLHRNLGLTEFLQRLIENKKITFLISNSPYEVINRGMTYMVGDGWRDLFHYIVIRAKKPDFFHDTKMPFREFTPEDDCLNYQKITWLQKGKVYAEGNIYDFAQQTDLKDRGVLFLGDHLYSDLADPSFKLGWNTGAIVAELSSEINSQNTAEFGYSVQWVQILNALIEMYQDAARTEPETLEILNLWMSERNQFMSRVKLVFNPQFGSIFRTYHSPSFFMNRLSRLADVYTSRLPNFLSYSLEHLFHPRRFPLAHERSYTVHPEKLGLLPFIHEKQSAM